MLLPKYQLNAEKDYTVFKFLSIGPHGEVSKLITFTETGLDDLYNLAFGDNNEQTGEIDDEVVTNNNDTEKVLATIVAAIFVFTEKYPDAWVYATGSTPARTRLYRMGISKYYEIAQEEFHIFGELKNDWEIFEIGGNYEGFVVKRKTIKFNL